LKEFAQYLGLLGVLRHAVHLGLQLRYSDRTLPVIFQHLRLVQIVCHFLFQLRLRHDRIERWLGIGSLFRPYPMTPVNFFNSSLVSYALVERQRSLGNLSCRLEPSLRECERDHAHGQQ
jgi:hypothetical protein